MKYLKQCTLVLPSITTQEASIEAPPLANVTLRGKAFERVEPEFNLANALDLEKTLCSLADKKLLLSPHRFGRLD